MNILITGAKGFVGKNLSEALKCVRDGKDKTREISADINLYEFDIDTPAEKLDEYCKDADFVYHLAGVNRPKNEMEFMEGNFGFTSKLLESLKTQGLSQQEMLNRLGAIVDAESARPEGKRDRELIQACIDLQWFLTTGEHYTSKKEVARLKLDSALHKREKQTANGHRHSAKVLAAVFCLVAVVIVLPIAGQTLLSRKWIEGQTVDS